MNKLMFPINQIETADTVENLEDFLLHMNLMMPLMNALPNATFFIKDTEALYRLANSELVKRCSLKHLHELIGKRADEVFTYDLGMGYTEQDHQVMRSKRPIFNQLELHVYESGSLGWCLTTKTPLLNQQNHAIGMMGISIDIQDEKFINPNINSKLKIAEEYISQHFEQIIDIKSLATMANLSISQLERQFKAIFQMTPQQYIQKKRFEYAIELLGKEMSITEISIRCGYADHSAFSRKFKELTSMTPSQFKQQQNRLRRTDELH